MQKDYPYAFPIQDEDGQPLNQGMTMRQFYKAQILNGMMANEGMKFLRLADDPMNRFSEGIGRMADFVLKEDFRENKQ